MNTRNENPSRLLVLQRVRNRIIEYLELAASYERQRTYQRNVPVNVVNEVINMWEDQVQPNWRDWLTAPVFSPAEQDAISYFCEVWTRVAEAIPDRWPELEKTIGTRDWEDLRHAAEQTVAVFADRGRFPEEVEIGFEQLSDRR